MTIADLPVWSFPPNWSSEVTETLEWLTDILGSPTGSEQRRCLRYFPRTRFEYVLTAGQAERSYLDNMLDVYGTRTFYLPMWHDTHIALDPILGAASFIPCVTAISGEMVAGDVMFIGGPTVFDYALVEIQSIDAGGIHTVAPVPKTFGAFARLHRARKAQLVEQPTLTRHSDEVVVAPVQFRVAEAASGLETGFFTASYRSLPVFTSEPEYRETLNFDFDRLIEELDNATAVPIVTDTADKPFTVQQHGWTLTGRAEHASFKAFLQSVRGRAMPFWLPTYFSDFTLVADVAAAATTMTVVMSGFRLLGGPRRNRQDICILLVDGTLLFRRITASAAGITSATEVLVVDSPLPAIAAANVQRISFMVVSRLNQDSVSISHKTDTEGTSTVGLALRSAPDTRTSLPGF